MTTFEIPTLTTERLRLRAFAAGDLDAYAAMQANPEVMRFLVDGRTHTRVEVWRIMAGFLGHYPQAPPGGETDDDRANDKPAQQDQRERHKYARYRNSRFQQIDRKERSAAGQRNTMNSIMQIEQVDTAVAKKRHRECPWRVMEEIDVSAIRPARVVVTWLAESER
jgi:hypothetical protein